MTLGAFAFKYFYNALQAGDNLSLSGLTEGEVVTPDTLTNLL
jgi:hypothetical protein